ncbi:MAG TPA: hypothetical protein VNC14_06395 [Lapillicoccus sp.]|nr:hypothetical protein [Lapillicoccus sp.]
MRLDPLCALDLHYTSDFHLARPYGNESGSGWGVGDDRVKGERLSGIAQWSNQPTRRGDGAMLRNARGVVATEDGGEVLFDPTGRTVFVDREGEEVGRQLLMVQFASEDDRYAWLNNAVCIGERHHQRRDADDEQVGVPVRQRDLNRR